MQLKLSIVVCVYNEEQNILPLIENINRAIQDIDYEILFVDDGSTDSTLQKLKQIQNSRLKIIEFLSLIHI